MNGFVTRPCSPRRVSPITDIADALLVVPLVDVDAARDALIKVEVAAQLSQRVLEKSDEYGSAATLAGVRDILEALVITLAA